MSDTNPGPATSISSNQTLVLGGTQSLTTALVAGASNNLNPTGTITWPTNYGRLILTAPSGAANITGLVAGVDGQSLFIFNNDGTNSVTLNSQNTGSSPSNRFVYFSDLVLSPGVGVFSVYDATIARWLLT